MDGLSSLRPAFCLIIKKTSSSSFRSIPRKPVATVSF
uniref:Uncharacterized protein n=1 Tax=Anguilla anguilla TaxID=7936 RepID=A0A0E9UXD3_ANGAN